MYVNNVHDDGGMFNVNVRRGTAIWHNGAAARITPQRDNPLLEAKTKRTECQLKMQSKVRE
jgi:hypothetical protein